MSLHPTADKLVAAYSDAYALLKKPRKLHAVADCGAVELELHFEDGTARSFAVTPLQVM